MDGPVIFATLTSAPGRRDELRDALHDQLVYVEEHEPGTLVYLLHEDETDPDRLWFYERYADEEAFRAHGAHVREALGGLAHLYGDRPQVVRTRLVGGKGAP